MPPTIRIDDEVFSWLQKHARPFEDTPNSVLRRLAGLDNPQIGKEVQKMDTINHTQESFQRTKPIENIPIDSNSLNKTRVIPLGITGQKLNAQWKVGVRHALFHRDGHWYNNLERFPGALFDPDGYIVFRTEQDYRTSAYLRIGKETNVPNGISRIPGYVKKVRS
jgi:hypothetical protein